MAIDRLVPLTIIALVAIIFPIMGQLLAERVPTDDELLTYLRYEGPSSSDFKPALKSIQAKEQVKIGGFTVASLLCARKEKRMLVDDCLNVSFSKSSGEIDESDLTLVLNVFNVVNYHNARWKKSCAQIIRNNFASTRLTTDIRSTRPTDDELVAKLREKELLAWEVRIILKAIRDKKKIIIGPYSVEDLFYSYDFPEESYCRSYSFLNGPEDIKDSDLTLALNVFNFIYHSDEKLKESCAEVIKRTFDWSIRFIADIGSNQPSDDELFDKLREKLLFTWQVRIILNAVRDKSKFHIGEYDVEKLWNVEKHWTGLEQPVPCLYVSFSKSLEEIKDSDLTLALNVFNFVYNRNKVWQEFCAERIKIVFANDKRAAELDEKILTTDEIRNLLEPEKDNKEARVWIFTVREILDDANKDSATLEDCEYDSFMDRRNLKGGPNLVANIHNFIHFARLVSFCAENFRTVLDKAVTDEDKQLIRALEGEENYYSQSDDDEDPWRAVKQHWQYIEYLMERSESEPYRKDLEEIKSELGELIAVCGG